MTGWKRPENVPYPQVWRKFEGKKEVNGAKRKYWVQDLTEEYKDEAVELMCTVFIRDEALCKYSKAAEDPVCVQEFRHLWTEYFNHKLALICFTEGDNGKPEIASINFTHYATNDPNSDFDLKSPVSRKILGVVKYIYGKVNVEEKLGIKDHLSALGLLVLPKYRGEGIGVEVLKSRRDLCLAVGLKASLTLFTSNTSQAVARKAGFQDVVDVPYEELEKVDPLLVFPGIKEVSNSQKYMYIKYE